MNRVGVLLLCVAEATLRSRLSTRRVAQPLAPENVIPGDVDAVQEPLEDVLGAVSDDVLGAAAEIQGAVVGVGESAGDPNAVAGNLLSQAEGTFQDATAGRGLVSDVISRSLGVAEQAGVAVTVKATTKDGKVIKKVIVAPTAAPIITTVPAAYNGVYCRGAACQYRATTTSIPSAIMGTGEPLDTDEAEEEELEFCRGLGCPRKRGWPVSSSKERFQKTCLYLFNSYGDHQLMAPSFQRKAGEVAASYVTACKDRVGMLEASECLRYGDVFVAALAPKMRQVTVGEPADVCGDAFNFIKAVEQAQIDLELITVPGPHATGGGGGVVNFKQISSATVGPCSARGQAWHQWNIRKRNRIMLDVDSPGRSASYLQGSNHRFIPNCSGTIYSKPQSQTKYLLRAGSADGKIPAVEMNGAEFVHCVAQINEITEEAPLSAARTVDETKTWCDWMASDLRPEWDVHTCVGMTELLAFALRRNLGSSEKISAQEVCKNLYLATGTVHRFEQIIVNAWRPSTRGASPSGPVPPSLADSDVREWLDESARRTDIIEQKLRAQHHATAARDNAKRAVESWKTEVHALKTDLVFPDSQGFRPASNKRLRSALAQDATS